MYSENMDVQPFQPELHAQVTKNKIVQITPGDIQKHFLSHEDRITWILFFYQDCMKTVSNEVNLYKTFSDKLDLVIISLNYKVQEIKYEEFYSGYPIYFISVASENMRVNQKLFLKHVFGKQISKQSLSATNIFVQNNRIIHTCYSHDINEDLLNFITGSNSNGPDQER